MSFAMYGPKSPATNLLTEAELTNMNPQELVDRIHNQNSYKPVSYTHLEPLNNPPSRIKGKPPLFV